MKRMPAAWMALILVFALFTGCEKKTPPLPD